MTTWCWRSPTPSSSGSAAEVGRLARGLIAAVLCGVMVLGTTPARAVPPATLSTPASAVAGTTITVTGGLHLPVCGVDGVSSVVLRWPDGRVFGSTTTGIDGSFAVTAVVDPTLPDGPNRLTSECAVSGGDLPLDPIQLAETTIDLRHEPTTPTTTGPTSPTSTTTPTTPTTTTPPSTATTRPPTVTPTSTRGPDDLGAGGVEVLGAVLRRGDPAGAGTGTATGTGTAAGATEAEATDDPADEAAHDRLTPLGLRRPSDAGSPFELLLAALTSAGLVLIIAFPSELVNKTVEAHYDHLAMRFEPLRRRLRGLRRRGGRPTVAGCTVFLLVCSVIYAEVDPTFRLGVGSLPTLLGLFVGLSVVTWAYETPTAIAVARAGGRTNLRLYKWALPLAFVCVVVTRIFAVRPPYLAGLIIGFEPVGDDHDDAEARGLLAGAVLVLAIGLVAWFLWDVVPPSAGRGDGWGRFVSTAISATVIGAVETVVFAFVPLRYLDGRVVWGWSRAAWCAIYGLALFMLVEVIRTPDSGYLEDVPWVHVAVVFGISGLFSLAVWLWGRRLEARTSGAVVPQPAA